MPAHTPASIRPSRLRSSLLLPVSFIGPSCALRLGQGGPRGCPGRPARVTLAADPTGGSQRGAAMPRSTAPAAAVDLLRVDDELSEEERLVRDTVRDYTAKRVMPHIAD